MRKPIIAGNWKMNKTLSEAVAFVEEVKNNIPSTDKVDAAICAPALFLAPMVEAAKGSNLKLGAQNMYDKEQNTHTHKHTHTHTHTSTNI